MSEHNYNDLLTNLVSEHKPQQLKEFIKQNPLYNYYFTTENGSNLLHICVERTSSALLETLQVLISQGLDPKAVNALFKTPIDIANENDNVAAVAYLKDNINKRMKRNQDYLNTGIEPLDYLD